MNHVAVHLKLTPYLNHLISIKKKSPPSSLLSDYVRITVVSTSGVKHVDPTPNQQGCMRGLLTP